MPSRLACVAILSCWLFATVGLLRRDVLPDLMITPPPDLRSIARAEEFALPTKWDIQVADDASLKNLRTVGQAVTETHRLPDGSTELTSTVRFTTGGVLKRTLFASEIDAKLTIFSDCSIDKSGNLRSFRARVQPEDGGEDLATLDGKVVDKQLIVRSRTPLPLPMLNKTLSLPYEPRGMVQNALGPIDRMPGLQIGQRWETKIVSPLTGRVEVVTVEVAGKHAIHWDKGVITTLEVVHHLSPTLTARTWVRKNDGLVIRQEVPIPFVKMILERIPSPSQSGQSEAKAP